MTLTAKQEKFAQCIADGMTQADAYRTAYSAGKMTDSSIHVNASKLMADAKIAQRLAELRQALSDRLLWAREDSVRVLAKIADAEQDTPAAARVSAVKELNAMQGYHAPTQSNVNVSTSNPAAILSALERKHRDG